MKGKGQRTKVEAARSSGTSTDQTLVKVSSKKEAARVLKDQGTRGRKKPISDPKAQKIAPGSMALYFEMRKRQELLKKKKNEAPFLEAEDSSSENELENADHNNSMSGEEEASKSSPVREVDSLEEHDDDVDSFDTSADMEHEVAAEKDIA
ncbi:unnamed protein product, partial [Cuscuta epithymum]